MKAAIQCPITGTGSAQAERYYTAEEVEKHNTRADTWVTVDGVVYNLTGFMNGHPGGPDLIMEHAGKDVSLIMRDGSSHDHSDSAFGMLDEYRVGLLEGYDGTVRPRKLRKRREAVKLAEGEEATVVDDNSAIFDTDGEFYDLIDLDKPIVTQLWALTIPLKDYLRFTHTPRNYRGGEPARFFESDIMEFLSRTPWWAVLGWTPVWMTAAYLGMTMNNYSFAQGLALFIFGVLNWTFLEYGIHRYVFHVDGMLPDHRIFISLHFLLHGVHHFLPMDRLRLVFPPALGVVFVTPVFFLMKAIYPSWMYHLTFAGALCGFMCYDLVHFYLHHGIPAMQYLRELKSYHLNHHYKDYHLGFGITSKLWDYVFNTVLYTKK